MAAVAKVDCVLVSPPGDTVIDKGYATEDFVAGDPVIIVATAPPDRRWEHSVARATGAAAHGIALKDCSEGGTVEYACQGEIDGYVGLTRGAGLTIVGGDVDDTAPATDDVARLRAVTASRIRFNLI